MKHTSYGKWLIECLRAALAEDEKWLKRKQRFENGIWSIRHYEERWLQFLLIKKTVGRSDFALAPEDKPGSFKDGRQVDLVVYGNLEKEKLVAAIELKGPWDVGKNPKNLLKDAREVLELQASRAKNCAELWVFFLVHASDKRKIDDWVKSAKLLQRRTTLEPSADIQLNRESPKKSDNTSSKFLRIAGVRVGD